MRTALFINELLGIPPDIRWAFAHILITRAFEGAGHLLTI